MIDTVDSNSMQEGYSKSRLPGFSSFEVEYIKGTADFLGFNYYTSRYVDLEPVNETATAYYYKDLSVKEEIDPKWKRAKSDWLYSVPEGFRDLLKWLKNQYDPEIWITENGWSDDGQLSDYDRVEYYNQHLKICLESIYCDKVNLTTFTAWSIIDNFEWMYGYT